MFNTPQATAPQPVLAPLDPSVRPVQSGPEINYSYSQKSPRDTMEDSEDSPSSTNVNNVRNNRKRKKSFLKNARKYGKRGYYGRGSQLDSDTYQYFIRIMEAYNAGFETTADKEMFVTNVFEQTVEQEVSCCCNQVGCRVIETLIPFANAEATERFMRILGNDLRPLCSDRFASHVLEALVLKCCRDCLRSGLSDDYKKSSKDFAIKVAKFLLNNLEDYMWDTYGSHVIRTCILGLSQQTSTSNDHDQGGDGDVDLPPEFEEIVRDYGERVIHWPQMKELPLSECSSAFLQVLLQALKKIDKKLMKRYILKLLSENFAQGTDTELPSAFLSKPCTMLLETVLEVAKPKLLLQIYENCFAGRLVLLACTRSTNFTVQKLVNNCQDKYLFELVYGELEAKLPDVIQAGHSGVIHALALGCKRFSTKQGAFLQSIMRSFDCCEPEERQKALVLCLARFTNYDTVQKQNSDNLAREKLSLHGTLILQTVIDFNKPIKIVHSLLSMEPKHIAGLLSNPMGCHIADSYVNSKFVGEKSREKLIKKMKGTYQELAATKYGSRCFDALFSNASLKNKIFIVEELSYKEASWANTPFGNIIAGKVNLRLFKARKDEWKNSLASEKKAEKLFSNILQE